MKTDYEQQAEDFLAKTSTRMEVQPAGKRKYFPDDEKERAVFTITLIRQNGSYSFEFGQSIAAGSKKPRAYDVLACIEKSDPGTFEDWCSGFGYSTDSRKALETYLHCQNQYASLSRLFTSEQLTLLQEIQ